MSHSIRKTIGVKVRLPNGEERFLPSKDCLETMAKLSSKDMYSLLKDLQKVANSEDIVVRFK